MDRKALLSIERELWTEGPDAYRRHLDDECLVAFAEVAGVWTRDQVAASVEAGPRWRDPVIDVVGWTEPARGVAILTYRVRAVRDGERYRALVSSGYVRRVGGWKLAFHHQTPLSG